MGQLRNRRRLGTTLANETLDTLDRLSFKTKIPKAQLVNEAMDIFLMTRGYKIRKSTPEELAEMQEDKY